MKLGPFRFWGILTVSFLMVLSSCGGGGGGSASSENADMTTITGSISASSVSGATVSAKNTSGKTIAGPVTSDATGTFSIDVPTSSLASDLIIESDHGTFVDEASSLETNAGKMAAYIKGGTLQAGSSVGITPTSTIHHDLVMQYGMTMENACAAYTEAFGYSDDVCVAPENSPATGTDTQPQLAFLRAAAFSQMTKDLGLTPDKQFDLLKAIAHDLADGTINGEHDNVPVVIDTILLDDLQCRFAIALAAVQNNLEINKTGLTSDKIGTVPFGKTFLTDSYKVEYVPGTAAAATGKTSFRLKVTNRGDGSPAPGLNIKLSFLMYMATKNHSTPVDPVTEDGANPGTYNCTAYYLMASGPGMGYWELKASIRAGLSEETAIFYPQVGTPVGSTTVRATLKGQADTIPDPAGAAQRNYLLFNDGATTASAFSLFLAAKETMMSFPAVFTGSTLHDASNAAWTVSSIAVSVSTDAATWIDATEGSGGHWTVSGLTGLTAGQPGTIYVRLTVNGEQKTTDGLAPAGPNGYASFAVTPQ
jgi:hypothetical protein